MCTKKTSISRKIIRHTLLITLLIALASIAVTYLYVFSNQYIQTITTLLNIQRKQELIVNNYMVHTEQQANNIPEYIQPFIGTASVLPVNTIAAIELREKEKNPYFVALHIFVNNESYYGNPILQPSTLSNSSVVYSSDGELQSYIIWKHITPVIQIGLEYDFKKLSHELLDNITPYNNTFVGQLYFSIDDTSWVMRLENNNGKSESFITKNNSPVPISNTKFSDILLQKNGSLLIVSAITNSNWHIETEVSAAAIAALPTSLLRYLLLLTILFGILALILARGLAWHIVRPIILIQKKLLAYSPSTYQYAKTIYSKDELESLDTSIEGIAKDLSTMYSGLENKVIDQHSAIQKVHNRDNTLFNKLSIGLIIVDQKGSIKEINSAMKHMMQIENAVPENSSICEFMPMQKKDVFIACEKHPVREALEKGAEVRLQTDEHYSIQTAHKSWIPVHIVITPITENSIGQGAIIMVQNADEEYKVEMLKSEFIGLVSHQLRSPLSSIQWYSELLSDETNSNFTNEQRSFIVELRLASQKLGNMITEMMDANRLHGDEINPKIETFNVISLLQGIISDATSLAAREAITITVLNPIESVQIVSDPILIGIVLQNIISNAVKYSPHSGTVRIRLELNTSVFICHISDDGIGIPPADQDRIFQKLYRAKNAIQKSVDGSGLGLYASKKIMKVLGGHINFSSIESRGSTFSITIPLVSPKNPITGS